MPSFERDSNLKRTLPNTLPRRNKRRTRIVRVVSHIRTFGRRPNSNYQSLNPRVMIIPDDLSGIPDGDGDWSSDTNRLLKTVEEENRELLSALLAKGASVNAHGGVFHETPLHKAAQQGWVEGVQLLLSHGATANSKNQFGQTPLHYASASKSCECVRILLESGCHATLDHRDVRGHTPLHDAAAVGHPEGVKLLLKAGASVTVRDNKNEETPLHKSAKARCVESMVALLNKGADMGTRDKTGESVLSYVLRHLPAGMEALLDECLITNADKLSSKKLEVSFNFVPLAGSSEMNQMKILSDVVDLGHPKLLLHPVCEAFLLLKWHNVRKLFFIEVIFYFVHAILATLLILDKFVWRGVKGTYPEKIPPEAYDVLEIILLLMAVIILLKQVLTIIQSVRTWIFSIWHVLNGVIPVLVLLVVPGNPSLWQHHFATATLLLIWVQCMLHIGRFPGCGIYVAMFTRVAKVFVRIFLIFFCLLLAFSMSFYVSKFGNQYNVTSEEGKMEVEDMVYSNPISTFIKTLTMMIGELDFDSDFVTQLGHLNGTSHIIYFAFVILVSIILSNLLVALAVNDVQGLRNSAHLERLIKQMELVFQMEKTFGSVLSLAYIINFKWLHQKIKLFVHDFSKTRVFLQPFHPQKGSKLMLAEKGVIREINLRQNHVAKVMDCLRLRQEEASATTNRKLSDRKSLQVRGEYSSFGGSGDEIRDLLKAVERNLLSSLSEKIDVAMVPLASLSHRVRTLEEMYSTDGGETERKTSAPVELTAHPGSQSSRFSNHVGHPSSMRVHSRRSQQLASNTLSLRHPFRLPQQSAPQKLQHYLSQPPPQTAPPIATQTISESKIQETRFVSQETPEQDQNEPRALQQLNKSEAKDTCLNIQLENIPPQRSTSLPSGNADEVPQLDSNHVDLEGNEALENG